MRSVLVIGVSCLALAVMLSIVPVFEPRLHVQALIVTLSDAFKLCLGALLALLNEHGRRARR